jgi:hypothetical protein
MATNKKTRRGANHDGVSTQADSPRMLHDNSILANRPNFGKIRDDSPRHPLHTR